MAERLGPKRPLRGIVYLLPQICVQQLMGSTISTPGQSTFANWLVVKRGLSGFLLSDRLSPEAMVDKLRRGFHCCISGSVPPCVPGAPSPWCMGLVSLLFLIEMAK